MKKKSVKTEKGYVISDINDFYIDMVLDQVKARVKRNKKHKIFKGKK